MRHQIHCTPVFRHFIRHCCTKRFFLCDCIFVCLCFPLLKSCSNVFNCKEETLRFFCKQKAFFFLCEWLEFHFDQNSNLVWSWVDRKCPASKTFLFYGPDIIQLWQKTWNQQSKDVQSTVQMPLFSFANRLCHHPQFQTPLTWAFTLPKYSWFNMVGDINLSLFLWQMLLIDHYWRIQISSVPNFLVSKFRIPLQLATALNSFQTFDVILSFCVA